MRLKLLQVWLSVNQNIWGTGERGKGEGEDGQQEVFLHPLAPENTKDGQGEERAKWNGQNEKGVRRKTNCLSLTPSALTFSL